ncbi:MAG: EAL domain-containing protein [Nitrospira sp.]|nr:MAG: EAL domain-containing protein [Nitrospira sp.]
MEREEFKLYYQPIISLETGRLSGFEALLRWQHPKRGLVSPNEYIHVVEDTGLILPVGRWVILEACNQLRQWQTQYETASSLTMSINLSGKQFIDRDLFAFIGQVLNTTKLTDNTLLLEVTESVMMENIELSAALLTKFRSRRIRTCIDDFGTGYSSLSYLQKLPIDRLKIDHSFVARMGDDPKSLEIVHTIISLAQTLGTQVIAEGAETAEQVARLKIWKCQYGQGFYFSTPLPPDAAAEFLAADRRW